MSVPGTKSEQNTPAGAAASEAQSAGRAPKGRGALLEELLASTSTARGEADAPSGAASLPEAEVPPAPQSAGAPAPLAGLCLDHRHPTLVGRLKVRWLEGDREERCAWLPAVRGLGARAGDRVLLQRPVGWEEPLVTAVIDGTAGEERRTPAREAGQLTLGNGEGLTVCAERGEPLLELRRGEGGLSVRLLKADAELDLPGILALSAEAIRLRARRGDVELSASDDVVLHGELVRLND